MASQWIRKIGLTITTDGKALDLSALRIKFKTTQMDLDSSMLPMAVITVFNPSEQTRKQVQNEYQEVLLQAGYQDGEFGAIFKGQINEVRVGRYNATDSFLTIVAADGYEFGRAMMNRSIPAGSDVNQMTLDHLKELASGAEFGVDADSFKNSGVTNIRGKVLWGSSMLGAKNLADNNAMTWTVDQGQLTFVPFTGYAPGDAVVLSTTTGLIGVPEATLEGINATCLLNPRIRIGQRVQIKADDINNTVVRPNAPRLSAVPHYANRTVAGFYRALVVEHEGDTRGQEWYTNLVCLALDASAAVLPSTPDEAFNTTGPVSPFGYQGIPSKAS